ncbi:hypothetical protein J6590_083249 [Homalodisca vitripennis]|nr:hypothetical protein J6590_083249 [Homalodisca vitripennis]
MSNHLDKITVCMIRDMMSDSEHDLEEDDRIFNENKRSSAIQFERMLGQIYDSGSEGEFLNINDPDPDFEVRPSGQDAKGDSTGPPKRTEPSKVESPVKKMEEKKKELVLRKVETKKDDSIVPPGTEGEVGKEPAAPGTEDTAEVKKDTKDLGGHRSRELVKSEKPDNKRPRSANSSHRSRGGSPILTFDKIKEERERQRLREKERLLREEERRRETERMRQREIDRKQREESERLDRERKKLKMERERLLREKDDLLKLKSERQRLERERQKLERERLEKEKEELERLKRQNLRLEEEARRKRSLSSSRDREYESRKRPATEARYIGHHSSSQSRYTEPSRSSDYKKEPGQHKNARDMAPPPRRPSYEPEPRRLVTSVSTERGTRESWQPKDRERFLNARNVKLAEIYLQLRDVYGEHVMSEGMNGGRINVHDENRSGLSSLVTDDLVGAINQTIQRTDVIASCVPDGFKKCSLTCTKLRDSVVMVIKLGSVLSLESKQQSMEWRHTISEETKIQDDNKGVLLIDFLLRDETINAARYCKTLRKLRRTIQNKQRGMLSNGIVLLHDNAWSHTAGDIQTLHLFLHMKRELGGQLFETDDEVKTGVVATFVGRILL